MEISELSVKFFEAGLVKEGEKYSTPLTKIPLSALFAESNQAMHTMPGQTAQPAINLEGVEVNFVSRKLEGTLNLSNSELQRVVSAFQQILNLHDKLRNGAVVTIKTGFSLGA